MTPLERLNDLPRPEAEAEFGSCCGSPEWARRMAEGRPFGDARELLETADLLWWSLSETEWREAFRSHPRIGERSAEAPQSTRAAAWSTAEQAGVGNSPEATLHALV
ncbi:MAG: decarboxylase, partial [Gemmatimonadota bacterium]|nr:decarboxylase [Gemmatimonadota bacterium]